MKEVTMCCTTCPSGCALKVMIGEGDDPGGCRERLWT